MVAFAPWKSLFTLFRHHLYLLEGTEPFVTRCTSRWLGVLFVLSPWCNQLLSWTLNLFVLDCSLVTGAEAPRSDVKNVVKSQCHKLIPASWESVLDPSTFLFILAYINKYLCIYKNIIFVCVHIHTQAELVQQFPALTTPVEVCGWMKSFLSWWELVKQLWGGNLRPLLWGIESSSCEGLSGTQPISYTPGKLRLWVLSIQNTDSPLFSGEREQCHFNVGFKLVPCGIPLENVGRKKKQKQQDIYGIAGFEAFLALS